MNDFVSGRRRWATAVVAGVACLLGSSPLAADPFINLTFDEPDLSGPLELAFPGGPFIENASQLLRGWNATDGGVPILTIGYAPYLRSTDGGPLNVVGHSPDRVSTAFGANEVWLRSAFPGGELRLGQMGTIPADAAGLVISSAGYIQAFINGVKVGEVNPNLGTRTVLDVSPYTGQNVSLEFLVRRNDSARIDVLGFTSVPEPSTWALLGLGAVALGIGSGWKRRD